MTHCEHAELGLRIRVYLACLSCMAIMMRMVAMTAITMVISGINTARAIVHPSMSAGLVAIGHKIRMVLLVYIKWEINGSTLSHAVSA